jgi:hypothetical protein
MKPAQNTRKTHATCEHFRPAKDGATAYCQAHPPGFVVVVGIEGIPPVQCVYPNIHNPDDRACGEWKKKVGK